MKTILKLFIVVLLASCTQQTCPTYAKEKFSLKPQDGRKVMPIKTNRYEQRNKYAFNSHRQ